MSRISRHAMLMEMARTASKRSTCHRLNVGAIIAHEGRVISCGYNGSAPGEAHCLGTDCPLSPAGACIKTRHAEFNALDFLPRMYLEHTDLVMYCTHSPCPTCANLIAARKIAEVYYEVPYRDFSPVQILLKHKVKVFKYTPSGYLTDHQTNKILELA